MCYEGVLHNIPSLLHNTVCYITYRYINRVLYNRVLSNTPRVIYNTVLYNMMCYITQVYVT
jgi:hypothetical protein